MQNCEFSHGEPRVFWGPNELYWPVGSTGQYIIVLLSFWRAKGLGNIHHLARCSPINFFKTSRACDTPWDCKFLLDWKTLSCSDQTFEDPRFFHDSFGSWDFQITNRTSSTEVHRITVTDVGIERGPLTLHARILKHKMLGINEPIFLWPRECSDNESPIGQWLKNRSKPELPNNDLCQEQVLSCHLHQEVFRLPFSCCKLPFCSMGTVTASECQILPLRATSSFENLLKLWCQNRIFSTSSPGYVWAQECGRSERASSTWNAETELCCLKSWIAVRNWRSTLYPGNTSHEYVEVQQLRHLSSRSADYQFWLRIMKLKTLHLLQSCTDKSNACSRRNLGSPHLAKMGQVMRLANTEKFQKFPM